MRKIWPKLRTIGPTIPYEFLNNDIKALEDEENHGLAQFKSDQESGKLFAPQVHGPRQVIK